MPQLESAFKDVRRIKTRTARNLVVKNAIRQLRKTLTKAEGKQAQELLSKLQATLDKAAKTHVIHKNKAARLKSRLAKRLATKK
ncbi:MAG: 30S ribosomal protein S20 [Candidatus Komeilibacteria bacterium]|nr:30S ribosomal protein S20 [Candidatus Komeilibacteria bacterium]